MRRHTITWTMSITLVLAPMFADAAPKILAVSWNDATGDTGVLAALHTAAPWGLAAPPVTTGRNAVLRAHRARVFAVSPTDGTITAIDGRSWSVVRTYDVGAASEPQDIVVASRRRAYVSRATATHLLRLDLRTGETVDAVDLSIFGDNEGPPDLGRMAVYRGQLFVQVRRLDSTQPGAFLAPAMIAVVDLATEQIVDVDPGTPGVQAIELQGTPPRFRMQIVRPAHRMFVSATWAFFDHGGIEAIDLDALQSDGLVLREEDGKVGADLGAFVMLDPDRGYLTFSTDLLLSSHLNPFDLSGAVGPELHVSLDYFAPAIVHARRPDLLFLPERRDPIVGVQVFRASTGQALGPVAAAIGGPPSDLLAVSVRPRASPRVHSSR